MRVMLPNGAVTEVKDIYPVVEKRFRMDGTERRLAEAARSGVAEANGLYFLVDGFGGSDSVFSEKYCLVGNLSNGAVKDALATALAEGVLDLSKYDFQPWGTDEPRMEFDNGEGAPYFMEYDYDAVRLRDRGCGRDSEGMPSSNGMAGTFNPCCGHDIFQPAITSPFMNGSPSPFNAPGL